MTFHDGVTQADLDHLREIGIIGGTLFKRLPMVYISATRRQIIAVWHTFA